jgi:hypothetical protein
MPTDTRLLGLWRLAEAKLRFADTGEITDLMGPAPAGFLVFMPQGRMLAIVTDTELRVGDTSSRMLTGMLAYSGLYSVEGDRFITDVDLSWHPGWLHTQQIRYFEIDGDELRITTPDQTRPVAPDRAARGILVWQRER